MGAHMMLNTLEPLIFGEKKIEQLDYRQPFSGDRLKIWSFPSFGTSNGGSGTVTINVAFWIL